MQVIAIVVAIHRLQFLAQHHIKLVGGIVDMVRIRQAPLGNQAVDHAERGGDAAACGNKQRLNRLRIGQIEIPLRQADGQVIAYLDIAHDVVGDSALVDGLHRDREAVVFALGGRGNGVGTGVMLAIGRDPHSHMLPRPVPAPVQAGSQGERARVFGFIPHFDYSGLQLVGGPQRIHQLQVMGGAQWPGKIIGDGTQSRPDGG